MVIQLNQDLLDQALIVSGHHSMDTGIYTKEMIGQLDGDQRRVLGLLEAIDYGCFDDSPSPSEDINGIYCIALGNNTEDDVKQYLVEHKKVVQSLPVNPFVLGLLAGTFDFLYDDCYHKGEKE